MNRETDQEDEDFSKMRNGKVSWWIMGLLAIVIGISLTGWLNWVYGMSEIVNTNSQRITRLEECTIYIKDTVKNIDVNLDRIISLYYSEKKR